MGSISPIRERTTIMASKTLLDRVQEHVLHSGDSQTDFVVRAIVNQLEKEGDFEIREMLEVENGDD